MLSTEPCGVLRWSSFYIKKEIYHLPPAIRRKNPAINVWTQTSGTEGFVLFMRDDFYEKYLLEKSLILRRLRQVLYYRFHKKTQENR